jgi:hypothetical protein
VTDDHAPNEPKQTTPVGHVIPVPDRPTQLTQPAKGEPIEIPVPSERDFEKLIGRAVKQRPSPELGEAASGSDD